ncbi:LysR family transcriptional regulator [Vibrio gallicus]|uniref:LysR family transcriptional regulator n=1 Tax=Vibrio gallicus TaxID=190897 RepID=UPI0021C303CC|nr:LysR family transcriptional regulator [Vibrio gallicus]
MDKLQDMQLFISIVDNRSLAGAAKEMSLSAATVTMRLKAIEERYGVKLLQRTTRHISLTDSGAEYYRQCQHILDQVVELENVLTHQSDEVSGIIKISAPKDVAKQILLPMLSEFCNRYPNITPQLNFHDHLFNVTEAGMDLIIRYGDLPDSSLISRRLAKNHRLLVASPSYLSKHATLQSPVELSEHRCLVMMRNNEALKHWYFRSTQQQHSITVEPAMLSDDGEVIRYWAVNGQGIALKSSLDVAHDLKVGNLVPVLADHKVNFNHLNLDSADLNLIYASRLHQPKRISLLIDFFVSAFEHREVL